MKPTRHLLIRLLGGSLLTAATTASGQTIWTGAGTDDLWTNPDNWNPGGNPPTGAAIQFNGSTDLQLNNTLGTARTIGSLTFTADQSETVTVNTVAGTPLTFSPGTIISVATGDHKFAGTGTGTSGTSRDLIFGGTTGNSFVFDIAEGASFEIEARMGNAGGTASNRNFEKSGAGTLIFSGNSGGGGAWQHNAGTGFRIQSGVLRFSIMNAGGNSANNYIVANGAALELAGSASQAINNGTYTLNGTGIEGNGALRSIGGNNTITGTGTGGIDLATNSSIGVDSGSLRINQIVKGSGSLTKVGAGSLILEGANTHTGGIIISSGTLEVRGSVAGSSGITNDAALVFNSAADQSYGNAISGGGTLTKQGEGVLTLSVNNSYTGDTTVSAGVLQIGTGGTTGTLGANSNTFIASGAELRIERSTGNFGYSYFGDLSGSGTVAIPADRRFNFRTNQENSGDLSFALDGILAINTSDGITMVELGELSGSGTIQRAGTAPPDPLGTLLSIGGKNTNSTYSGNITGIAEFAVDKVGTGTLTLGGTYSHGGPTTVSAGTLLINGSLGNSDVTVDPLAAIGGTGSLGRDLSLAATSFLQIVDFDNPLAVAGMVTFGSGFGIANLLGVDWDELAINTPLTVISTTQSFGTGDIDNFGIDNAIAVGANGRQAYFTSGNLALVVIPEPSTALLGGLGLLILLHRRRP